MTEEEARLPQNLLRVLPDDPFEQLDLARKIASVALASRLSALESRVAKLKHSVEQKDTSIEDLQRRISEADQAIQRANIRILKTTDDQIRLAKENELLHGTISSLKQDVSKMESFRKTLVHSLQLDNPLLGTIEEMVPSTQVALESTKLKSAIPSHHSPRSPLQISLTGEKVPVEDDLRVNPVDAAKRRMLLLKARPSRKSMSDLAKVGTGQQYDYESDTAVVKRGIPLTPPFSPPKTSPLKSRSATGSPVKRRISPPKSPLIPRPIVPATAPSSPPRSPMMMTKVDGKEFFRQAKSRLSYDQFRALLNTIKELNTHKQTREDALKKAEEIFGRENNDLYAFLCQHLPS